MTQSQPFAFARAQIFALAALLAGGMLALPAKAAHDLSAPEAAQLAADGKVTIIDIRTPQEWRQTGVAPGVKRINMLHPEGPRGFAQAVLNEVGGDPAAPIALICRTGNRTSQMQKALMEMGFTNVHNIAEGMAGSRHGPGWMRRGLPVEACASC